MKSLHTTQLLSLFWSTEAANWWTEASTRWVTHDSPLWLKRM